MKKALGKLLRITRRAAACAGLAAAFMLAFSGQAGAQQQKISQQDLQALLQKDEAVAVSVMSLMECRDHQIPGSACIPCGQLSEKIPALLKGRPLKVVLYGDSGQAEECLKAEPDLKGFNVSVLEGGFAAWKRAGYETASVYRIPRVPVLSISPADLQRLAGTGEQPFIMDVRENRDFKEYNISGSVNIPIDQVPARYYEIPYDRKIVIVDEKGRRSFLPASYLKSRGFRDVVRLRGGIAAWRSFENEVKGK